MKQSYDAARSSSGRTVRRDHRVGETRHGYAITKPSGHVPKIIRDTTSDFVRKYDKALKKLEKY